MKDDIPARQDNPDVLWDIIKTKDSQIQQLKKYKEFFEMLRLSNTPIGHGEL